jgi:hypothetical protein
MMTRGTYRNPIHRPPQIVPRALDRQKHFIHMPLVARASTVCPSSQAPVHVHPSPDAVGGDGGHGGGGSGGPGGGGSGGSGGGGNGGSAQDSRKSLGPLVSAP